MKQTKRTGELSLKPQQVSEGIWYYEEKGGLLIYFRLAADEETHRLVLPWRKVLKSVERYKQSRSKQ